MWIACSVSSGTDTPRDFLERRLARLDEWQRFGSGSWQAFSEAMPTRLSYAEAMILDGYQQLPNERARFRTGVYA
jgi:hypothetical protein